MQEDISIHEAAKYPWSVMARSLLKEYNVLLSEVDKNPRIVQRAEQRLIDALETKAPRKSGSANDDPYVELTSFFVTKALVDAIASMYLRRRWATAEAKLAEEFLIKETDAKLAQLANREFNWQVQMVKAQIAGRSFTHSIHFTNYLAATVGLRDLKWKLVNKRLSNGFVLLRKTETTRVIRAAVEQLLVRDIKKVDAEFPTHIQQVHDDIDIKVQKRVDRHRQELEGEIIPDAFPPCMQAILSDLREGKPLSHIARFAITAFLLNVGMEVDSIIELFMKAPDFREDLARYQIEHIAGKRGSTAYTPPSCAYMLSVRLCVDPDQVGVRRHPLNYYRYRRKRVSKP